MPNFKALHSDFRFNGKQYSKDELLEYASDLCLSTDYKKSIGSFLIDWFSSDNVILVCTSGSTGKPKSISLKKEQMVHSALATGSYFNLQPKNTALLCLPVDFIAGKMMLVRAMVLGLHLDIIDPAISSVSMIDKKYDFSAMVPMQVEAALGKLDLIEKLIIGGAPISTNLKTRLTEVPTGIFETYGMTETCTHIAIKKLGTNAFTAMPNVTFSLDNRNCLCIDAPKIADNIIVTNDIVVMIGNTRFEWLGRYDNIINSGGIKLHPEQLEKKFSKLISSGFFVAGLPDAALGTKLVLLVESKENDRGLSEKIVTSGLFKKYEIPKNIYFLPEFNRTKNGKIQRKNTLALLQK